MLCFLLGPYVDRMTLTMAGIKEKELTHLSAFFIQDTLDQRARTYTSKWKSSSQSDINPPLPSSQFSGWGRQVNRLIIMRGMSEPPMELSPWSLMMKSFQQPSLAWPTPEAALISSLLLCWALYFPVTRVVQTGFPGGKGQESGVDIWGWQDWSQGIAPTKAMQKLGIPTCEPSQWPSQNAKKD